jgi:hypothetical protein
MYIGLMVSWCIYQYLYQYCRYWKILVKYWYYQYCSTSIAAGCFILSKQRNVKRIKQNLKGKILIKSSIFQNFLVSAILEDTGHCQNMSIVDIGRFWETLVIPVLQILEDSGKYW